MQFYEINLAGLIFLNALLFFRRRIQSAPKTAHAAVDADDEVEGQEDHDDEERTAEWDKDAARRNRFFLTTYLSAYLLATGADWLQGPHIYAIYRYDKHLGETTVAALYATGFISGAISSTFVGQIADRYGRRTACLIYCASYVVCCLTMLADQIPILLLGRVCGGIGTTLLYTSFESWMLTEYHDRGAEATGLSLATVFGTQTTLNSVVAILSGVIGEVLVSGTGTRKAPFLFAGFVSVLAAVWIMLTWTENYGHSEGGHSRSSLGEIVSAAKNIWRDKRVFALATASSIFESMMYLFVFFWSAAIASARAVAGVEDNPPFGLIFSCFMCAMMAGSQTFNIFSNSCDIARASYVLEFAMTFASLALMSTIINHDEALVFWAFCVVELCVGLYFPSMNFLKGNLIEDGSRAKVYSLIRLPLNAFVILAHSLAEEGDHHRNNVFATFGGVLLVAFVVVRRYVK